MIPITVKFFATFRELAGAGKFSMEVEKGTTVGDLLHQLEQQYPQLEGKLNSMGLTAVNETYTHRQKLLQPHDIVAFFPPVSGG